jgi:enhancing lycopene biosynthesis protein 2
MQLFNATNKEVEFVCGGVHYIFKPKESRDLPEYVALHALERAHAPLVVYTPAYDRQVKISDTVYSEMPWRKLVQMASARGVFRPGTARPQVEKDMEEYDNRIRGTLQESPNQEEGAGS